MTRRLSLGLESNLAVGIATVAKDDQPPIFSAVTKSSAGQQWVFMSALDEFAITYDLSGQMTKRTSAFDVSVVRIEPHTSYAALYLP